MNMCRVKIKNVSQCRSKLPNCDGRSCAWYRRSIAQQCYKLPFSNSSETVCSSLWQSGATRSVMCVYLYIHP